MIINLTKKNTTTFELLELLVERGGSDLHLSANAPPMMRLHGRMKPVEGHGPLDRETVKSMVYDVLTEPQRKRFEDARELDFAFSIVGFCRYRGNVHYERDSVGAVFRAIPNTIRSFDDLGLPPVVANLCERPHGLILVTGPTGSGKSTTLASMIDRVNREREEHIITVEDPIEFIHENKKCKIIQREVGSDTDSFPNALKTILRQDPDVVLVGEMRDLETIEMALRVAETGHLTFATLHTNTASSTINRIIDVFPANQQPQIRSQLAQVLEGVLCQALHPRADERGRAMSLEILVPDKAIKSLIRNDKIEQIPSAMSMGQQNTGMQTVNQSLASLYLEGSITQETAMRASSDRDELRSLIRSSDRPPVATAATQRLSGPRDFSLPG